MLESDLADMFLTLSTEEKRSFALHLEDVLHGRYFERSKTGKKLDQDFILSALTEWAEKRTNGRLM